MPSGISRYTKNRNRPIKIYMPVPFVPTMNPALAPATASDWAVMFFRDRNASEANVEPITARST